MHAEPAEYAERRFRGLGAFCVPPHMTTLHAEPAEQRRKRIPRARRVLRATPREDDARRTGGICRKKIPRARRVLRATPHDDVARRTRGATQKKDSASSARSAGH